MMQETFYDFAAFEILKSKNPLLVCDSAFDLLGIALPCKYVRFSGFSSNPQYEDIIAGVDVLRKNGCGFIVAIGGGSSIDAAKGIKYYSHADVPVMAVPTTSGTGSEATHFAAIYKNGEKYSVADERLLPDIVILQPDVLKTLPVYQKKCTMLDALCQAIESWWSKQATPESIAYSQRAIELVLEHMHSYLKNEDNGNKNMLIAAHFAGKAINITTTTAPHAMSYKLTSLYGLPHGHAAALCLPKVWRHMKGFDEIAGALGGQNYIEASSIFEKLLVDLDILPPKNASAADLDVLTDSVNQQRLQNNPTMLNKDTIKSLYTQILEVDG
ncbi:MAG: phosphonoacetaldehyde reductase [Oscillospiraceae bacterium]|nr:phosphonoacetaldehyde reductase [Oscillospiraceae bacterium]